MSGCTVEDRPALWELCRANDPLASTLEIGASLQGADLKVWAVYRDKNDKIRVAMYMYPDGAVHLVMKPEGMSDPEVKHGFLQLAREVHKAFKVNSNGITALAILCPKMLKPFMDMLYREGFLSREVYTLHGMHFTPAGDIDRAQ